MNEPFKVSLNYQQDIFKIGEFSFRISKLDPFF